MKILLPAIAVCCLVLVSLTAGAATPVMGKTIVRKSKNLQIDVRYPVTGKPAVDRVLADYAAARVAEIDPRDAAEFGHGPGYSMDVGYEVVRNDDKFFAVLFNGSSYTGGAHGAHFEESFTFLMPDGAQVFLPELVDGKRGLEKISRLAVADLNRRLLGNDSMTNAGWIAGGASPSVVGGLPFEWLPGQLVLHFGFYSVGPYAMGPQIVLLPMPAIADIVRANPRAPMPSFDCKAARTAIERAICADASLARADREVAEWYGIRLKGDASKVIADQRAWLKARDTSCASADTACLSTSYQRRLAALKQ